MTITIPITRKDEDNILEALKHAAAGKNGSMHRGEMIRLHHLGMVRMSTTGRWSYEYTMTEAGLMLANEIMQERQRLNSVLNEPSAYQKP